MPVQVRPLLPTTPVAELSRPCSEGRAGQARHSREGLMVYVADVTNLDEAREAKQGALKGHPAANGKSSATDGNGGSISEDDANRFFRQYVKHEKAWGQDRADTYSRCRLREHGVPRERVEIALRRIKRMAGEA
jgi:hypothetical protein